MLRNCFLFLFLLLGFRSVHAQSDSIVSTQLKIALLNDSSYLVTAKLMPNNGWHVYGKNKEGIEAPSFSWALETANLQGSIAISIEPVLAQDILFNTANVYKEAFEIAQSVVIRGFQPDSLRGFIQLNVGKGDQFYVLSLPISLALEKGQKSNVFQMLLPATARTAPVGACGETASKDIETGAWGVFFLGFLGGLIALITPCVFPMIPVTVSFFTKKASTKAAGIKNGLVYGLSIFLIYVLASVPFHIVGNVQPEIFNTISTNAWLNIIFFIVFIFFSISFFGFFEITLPSGIASKADAKSGLGSLGGIFFMAITLAIVSFSCTGPILGTLLVGSLQDGAWALTQGMAGFGLALALPFSLFAIFPQWLQSLPKSGGWLDTVKKVLAFLELALAFKFLSNADLVQHWGLLKREVFIAIWILISIGLTLYLFGLIRLPHDVKSAKISVGRKIAGLIAAGFAIYLAAGILPKNAHNLKMLSGFPPPTHYSLFDSTEAFAGLKPNKVNDYTAALQLAKSLNKPILIDFTGWACVNCRKMEENVWTDPAVASFIKEEYILLSLYVDDRGLLPVSDRFMYTTQAGQEKEIKTIGDLWATFQTENFNQSSQPLYVVLSPNEELLSNPVGYTPNIEAYLRWLKCSVQKTK